MTYIENIFVLLAAPVVACLVLLSGRSRIMVSALLSGMVACLFSSYLSAFFAQWVGADPVGAAVEVAPVVEETLKLLPLLFFLLVFEPIPEIAELVTVFIAVGFATMESGFYIAEFSVSSPLYLALRGLSAAMMHLTCGVIMAYGLLHVWKRPWFKIAGTFGMLSLVIVYHGLYNLLIAAGSSAQVVAVFFPLVTLATAVALRRGRLRMEEHRSQDTTRKLW